MPFKLESEGIQDGMNKIAKSLGMYFKYFDLFPEEEKYMDDPVEGKKMHKRIATWINKEEKKDE